MIEKTLIFYAGMFFGWFVVSLLSAADRDEQRQIEQDIDELIRADSKKQAAIHWLKKEGL